MPPGPQAAEPATLIIHMLGRFRLHRGGRDLHPETWQLQKAAGLLKYLIAEEGRWVPTDVLLEQFWPEMEPERARNALRTTAYSLRRALQPELQPYAPSLFIDANRGHYRFRTDSPHWCDMAELLRLARAARQAVARLDASGAIEALQQGLALYQDDFLPEDRHLEWTALWRERLRQVYLDMVLQLNELAPPGAPAGQSPLLEHLRAAVVRAPEREDVWRALLAALWRTGNPGEALRQYELLRQRLRRDFEVDPTPETQELVRQIRQGGHPDGPAGRSQPKAGTMRALTPHHDDGALLLVWPVFQKVVELERRRLSRWSVAATVLLLAQGPDVLDSTASWDVARKQLERALPEGAFAKPPPGGAGGSGDGAGASDKVADWQASIVRQLRRSDAACVLDSRRLLILLAHADAGAARRVVDRLLAADGHAPFGCTVHLLPLTPSPQFR